MKKFISIAIDGPSGAGKSSLAKRIASVFGFVYVDTGAIYRTVGYAAQCCGIDSKDFRKVKRMLPHVQIELKYDHTGTQRMILCGSDVTEAIRSPRSSIYASDISAMPDVRAFLLEMQRKFASQFDVVMDGRDIGTVVLPDAGLKIFLTASSEERARRRFKELKEKGIETSFEDVLKDIRYRDTQDTKRKTAPLRAATDAVIVDSTDLSFEGCFDVISTLIKERFEL